VQDLEDKTLPGFMLTCIGKKAIMEMRVIGITGLAKKCRKFHWKRSGIKL
jgi:hypothetical protein